MHLEAVTVENLTVGGHHHHHHHHLGQLDVINGCYVTSMTAATTTDEAGGASVKQQQQIQYCDVKPSFTTSPRGAGSDIDDGCDDPLSAGLHHHAYGLAVATDGSGHEVDGTEGLMVQYTKDAKDGLLESALNNPTADETESNW